MGKLLKQPSSCLFYGVRLGFLSDWPLSAAQAHTRRLYLVQRGNREQSYWRGGLTSEVTLNRGYTTVVCESVKIKEIANTIFFYIVCTLIDRNIIVGHSNFAIDIYGT